MPSGWRIRTVRADSGFFDQALLAYLEECGLPYIIVARMTKQVQGQFVNSAIHWREIDQGYAVGRRLIDVPGYTYRIWVTNRSEATETLWRDYNHRATIEQRIEELKNDMHADGFCAKKFYTTEAAFLGTILAYNLLSLYQDHVTAKEGWRKPSTLRAAVFVCGAILGATLPRVPGWEWICRARTSIGMARVLRFPNFPRVAVLLLAPHLGHAAEEFERVVQPFFKEHCLKCHDEQKQKGDLRLDTLGRDFLAPPIAMHWADIMDRITSGEMPPKAEPKPSADVAAQVAEWIATQLNEAEVARQATADRVTFHKLTRDEYANTIRDLLGITFDARDPNGLPEDPDWQGFERIGSVLTISPAHVEKYLAAAESILNEALALGPAPKVEVTRWLPAERRVNGELAKELATKGVLDQVRIDIVPNNGALDAYDLTVKTTGEYKVRVKLSGLRAKDGRAARLRIYATDLNRTLFEQDVEAPEDQPVTLEFQTHLPVGTHLMRIVNAVPGPNPEERASRPLNSKPFFKMSARQPWQIKLTDDDGSPLLPTLLVDFIEWEGPVQSSWPSSAHQQIFYGGETATKDAAYAREILTRFATRAYRRPVTNPEVDRLVKLFENATQLGDNFEAAVKSGLLAVLCSNHFIYLVEGSIATPTTTITGYELASRLSYFLWSTMPDEPLLAIAQQGKLHEPEALRNQVRRMMQDVRARTFAYAFPRQWLQLRRVGMFEPDKKLYPDYDGYLEKSMIEESTTFFHEVLTHNLGLHEFLDSNWTMLNERLAGHYGLTGVGGEAMQRVALKAEDHRGGLLTMASVLSLTSDGTRHRPVHRGKWVLESLLGKPPPPPPANVPAIKTSAPTEPKMSLRAKIEAHRDEANCAACHRKIDPLGLAFENFDAIGHWRTEETVRDGSGDNPQIDPSGELPDGRKFQNAAELKQLMLADVDKFALATTEKLATYALRRGMTFADRKLLATVAQSCQAEGYPLSTLIENFVVSELFQKR